MGFPGGSVVKNLPADAEDVGVIPGSRWSTGRGSHSRVLVWRISWTGEPGRLSPRVSKELDMTLFFGFFSITGYYKTLSVVPRAYSRPLLSILHIIMCIHWSPCIPLLHPCIPFGDHEFVFCNWVCFCFVNKFIYIILFRSHISVASHGICLSPSMIISGSICVATSGVILFALVALSAWTLLGAWHEGCKALLEESSSEDRQRHAWASQEVCQLMDARFREDRLWTCPHDIWESPDGRSAGQCPQAPGWERPGRGSDIKDFLGCPFVSCLWSLQESLHMLKLRELKVRHFTVGKYKIQIIRKIRLIIFHFLEVILLVIQFVED